MKLKEMYMDNKPTRLLAGEFLIKAAKKHEFIVINTDTKATGLENFSNFYPHRTIQLGISEQSMLGIAAGLSHQLKTKTIVSMFSVFASMRATDQLRNLIAATKADVVILATHSGVQVGRDGGSHAAIEDIGIIQSIPNMTLLQPSDIVTTNLTMSYIMEHKGPFYVRLMKEPTTFNRINQKVTFELGKPIPLVELGQDVVIFSTGDMVETAQKVAIDLNKDNIGATALELLTLKPLNPSCINNAISSKTKLVVVIEDSNVIAGIGSTIISIVSERQAIQSMIVGIPDKFSRSGSPEELYKYFGLNSNDIICSIKERLINQIHENSKSS